MVAQFVQDHLAHLVTDVSRRAAASFNGPLKNGDLVWQSQPVTTGPIRQGHTLVQAKKSPTSRKTSLSQLFTTGPIFDDHVYVLHLLAKLRGQAVQSLGNQSFKP